MAKSNSASEKKVKILQALDLCLREKPFDRTSIKDIARVAGVNHGLLHYYFKNKEDILINYIDYVMMLYKSILDEWLTAYETPDRNAKQIVDDFYKFMIEKMTLNKTLSAVFIEIWEIALYNPNVRTKLQLTYTAWIDILTDIIEKLTDHTGPARQIATASVAFFEGMALFSILLEDHLPDMEQTLDGFRKAAIAVADAKRGH